MKDILKAVVFAGIFAIPFLTLYVENDYFFPYITGKNFWFRIIVDVMFAAWVLLALADAKYRPKWSWLVGGFGAVLVVMFFANLFGVHPTSSFWSNFERMDGYVTLVHTFLYFLVLGSVMLTKALWQRLLNVSLAVAFAVALYGIGQYTGYLDGSSRIHIRLWNAAYMAIYMLFHIFFSFWLFVESKNVLHKIIYGLLVLMFTFVLIETGTRGTAVGLAAGIFVMSGYIGIFGAKFKEYRKYAIGIFAIMLIAATGFVLGRDSEFIQNNNNFARIANISLDDLTVRATIWGTALEGVAERPLLGYGQSNFNFVFNEYYEPSLYAQEQWFDRAHNIFMDWLVTGGVLGLLAYLSIFVAGVWYLLIQPFFKKDGEETFTVLERGVLLGILAGYFTHNLVVFDNIVSYIFFAIVLGLIHARVSLPIPSIQKFKVSQAVLLQVATPVVTVFLVSAIYFLHVPGMLAAGDIIDAFQASDPYERLDEFKTALNRDTFARQEITEQLAQQTINIVRNQNTPQEVKNVYASYTEEQLQNLIEFKPNDARIHVFAGSYYRAIGQNEQAAEQMQRAHELSPLKQSIIQQQGFVELSAGDYDAALEYFEEAYRLDERNLEAKEYYAGGLIYAGETEAAAALMNDEATTERFARSDFLVAAARQAEMNAFLIDLFEVRVVQNPENGQNWATLAFLLYEAGNSEAALATLDAGADAVPEFAPLSACVADNIENGRPADEGC